MKLTKFESRRIHIKINKAQDLLQLLDGVTLQNNI